LRGKFAARANGGGHRRDTETLGAQRHGGADIQEVVMKDVWQDFEYYFEIVPARSTDLLVASQALRYQVYCVEHSFLDARNYPNQLERDAYDDRSVHAVLRHRQSGITAATVRLVLADQELPSRPFPIEKFSMLRRTSRDNRWRVPRRCLGEISRFAVSKEFRRRLHEAQTSHGLSSTLDGDAGDGGRRTYPHIAVGLFKAILAMSTEHEVTHWYAVMEPSLLRLLGRFGIAFTPVGPLVDYHGTRQPCIAVADDVLSSLRRQRPEIWDFVTAERRGVGSMSATVE
jgi:N-acyl amino acid synthase of PEP-CTERM/exosortase system